MRSTPSRSEDAHETDPTVHGVLVGGGSLEAAVRRAAQSSGGRIEFLGALDRDALSTQYARAAVVLMPSRFEGLGMVALEAQAAGTPVVGFDVDGLRDAVGVGGVLVPAGDMTAMSQPFLRLSDHQGAEPNRGTRTRGRAGRASWDAIGGRFEEIDAAVR